MAAANYEFAPRENWTAFWLRSAITARVYQPTFFLIFSSRSSPRKAPVTEPVWGSKPRNASCTITEAKLRSNRRRGIRDFRSGCRLGGRRVLGDGWWVVGVWFWVLGARCWVLGPEP